MKIPEFLAIAQWVLLLGVGASVLIVWRQLGWHFKGLSKETRLGPEIGAAAASFDYVRVSDQTLGRFVPGTGAALLAFVDPMCPACEQLVASVTDAHDRGRLGAVDVLLVTSDPPSYLNISETFRLTPLEIGRVTNDDAYDAYGATATPLLVAIDQVGIVRGALSSTRTDDVEGLARLALTAPAAVLPLLN